MAKDPAIKKGISAKEVATRTSDELIEDSRGVFKRLFGYVKPHKNRLFSGILFGILAGISNGILLLVLKTVFTVVLPGSQGEEIQEVKGVQGLDTVAVVLSRMALFLLLVVLKMAAVKKGLMIIEYPILDMEEVFLR